MARIIFFGISGKVLASFIEDEIFTIEKTNFQASIQADGRLLLVNQKKVGNRYSQHKLVLNLINDEIQKRKEDIKTMEKNIQKCLEEIEIGASNPEKVAIDMGKMAMLKGQHKKRINELQNQTNVSVTFKQNCKIRFALLSKGVFNKLPCFSESILWCTDIEEKVELKEEESVSIITEDIPREYDKKVAENKYLYILGGYNNDINVCSSSVFRYNLSKNVWKPMASMKVSRRNHSVVVLDNLLYVAGGVNSQGKILSSVEKYDPIANEWIDVADMNEKRWNFAMTSLNGELYAVGGDGSSAEKYDTLKNEWTYIAFMKSKRKNHGLIALNGYLYATGGNSDDTVLRSVERYDPFQNQWVPMASLQSEREGMGIAVIGGQIYVLGGKVPITLERYDCKKNVWEKKQTFRVLNHNTTAFGTNGMLNVVLYPKNDLPRLAEYNPKLNTLGHIIKLDQNRNEFATAVISTYVVQ